MPFDAFNPLAVWTQVPLTNRTVTVGDKTGYSLTAGSYSIRASSTQHGTGTVASSSSSGSATISSVTTTRASHSYGGHSDDLNNTPIAEAAWMRSTLAGATSVTGVRDAADASQSLIFGYCVAEFF